MTTSDEYNRGKVDATLSEHAQHLVKINGSIDRFAGVVAELTLATKGSLAELTLAIQRLTDAADADRATVITTAKALEKAEAARRAKSAQGWTPFQRGLAVIGGLAAIAGIILTVLALAGH